MKKGWLVICMILLCSVAHGLTEQELVKNISDQVCLGKTTFKQKIVALRNFVHTAVTPRYDRGVGPFDEMTTSERLKKGVGWCHSQAIVFMDLAQKQGYTTRLVWLFKDNGASNHTVAEVLVPDGTWVMVDPGFNVSVIGDRRTMETVPEWKVEMTDEEITTMLQCPGSVRFTLDGKEWK